MPGIESRVKCLCTLPDFFSAPVVEFSTGVREVRIRKILKKTCSNPYTCFTPRNRKKESIRYTNALHAEWPMKNPDGGVPHLPNAIQSHERNRCLKDDSGSMSSLEILSKGIPLSRMMYIALDTRFLRAHFPIQLQQARNHVQTFIENLA